MKKIFSLAVLLMAAAIGLSAQNSTVDGVTYSNDDPYFVASGRFSAAMEKKIVRGLSVGISEELRLRYKENALGQGLDRMYTSLYFKYRPIKYLRLGLGYDFISAWKKRYADPDATDLTGIETVSYWEYRHRLSFDVSGIYKINDLQLSIRERIQMTHYMDPTLDVFEQPRNLVALKSRFKIAYAPKKWAWKPYLSAELRNSFNEVNLEKSAFDRKKVNGEYRLKMQDADYSEAYLNRVRVVLGTEWEINSRNSLDFYLLYDYSFNKDIKVTNTKRYLKSVTGEPSNTLALGVAYTFGW